MYTKYKTSKAIILAHCSLKNKKSNMPSCNKCTHHIHVKIKCVALFSFWWTVLNLIGEALTLLMYFSQLCLYFDLNGREFIDIMFFFLQNNCRIVSCKAYLKKKIISPLLSNCCLTSTSRSVCTFDAHASLH